MQLSITQSQGHSLRNDFISVQTLWSILTQTKQSVTSLGDTVCGTTVLQADCCEFKCMWYAASFDLVNSMAHSHTTNCYGLLAENHGGRWGEGRWLFQDNQTDQSVCSSFEGAMSGGFNFQVTDGLNFAPRQIFSITARALIISLEVNRGLSIFPGKRLRECLGMVVECFPIYSFRKSTCMA